MAKPKVLFVVGTRPDAIKTAPVVVEFQRYSDQVETVLVSTGQHREMLQQALAAFGLRPDHDLDVMAHGQTLAGVTQKVLGGLDGILEAEAPNLVFAQGDTTTTFVAGLASFYRQIPFAHIEAGLRTPDIFNPFPEEFNRRAVGLFAALHFPPTTWSAENLLREGVPSSKIFVTGNTGIDAVLHTAKAVDKDWYPEWEGRVVLLTTHRRENWGEPQLQIARAARRLVDHFPDLKLVVAMHRNPVVRKTLTSILAGHERIDLIEPPDYADFVKLMQRAHLILTDSGGVQEEAPTFGIPVLVLRTTTERPEGVERGTAKLVGTGEDDVYLAAAFLLEDGASYQEMAHAVSPYGDGRAAQRIRFAALNHLGIGSPAEESWGS
ncbi:MAG: UDP-N-acetylglucosamine 2-epimerase (non-hydrolyzing) [Armatimonadetes bacterium]|nr:UDP-N-acetylglucosamine 2-epimerase (non-hydrolyzing) [Armatimonadota bacterium]MBX3107764.1 UDP-N-acetylglucosamine 2-epimerase (non-hydrolyzing) [Fimbriimonadaceae bacterium]